MKTETSINHGTQPDAKLPVTSRYLFFYEGEEDGWTFEIEAKDHEEAFDKAYETHGPQVEDMYCRVI